MIESTTFIFRPTVIRLLYVGWAVMVVSESDEENIIFSDVRTGEDLILRYEWLDCGKEVGGKTQTRLGVLFSFAVLPHGYRTASSCIDSRVEGAFHVTFWRLCSSRAFDLWVTQLTVFVSKPRFVASGRRECPYWIKMKIFGDPKISYSGNRIDLWATHIIRRSRFQ